MRTPERKGERTTRFPAAAKRLHAQKNDQVQLFNLQPVSPKTEYADRPMAVCRAMD